MSSPGDSFSLYVKQKNRDRGRKAGGTARTTRKPQAYKKIGCWARSGSAGFLLAAASLCDVLRTLCGGGPASQKTRFPPLQNSAKVPRRSVCQGPSTNQTHFLQLFVPCVRVLTYCPVRSNKQLICMVEGPKPTLRKDMGPMAGAWLGDAVSSLFFEFLGAARRAKRSQPQKPLFALTALNQASVSLERTRLWPAKPQLQA